MRPSDYEYEVDGKPLQISDTIAYKGMMYSEVPNLVQCAGYMQAGAYTLRVDLTCLYACRILNYMTRKGYTKCVPRNDDPNLEIVYGIPLTSGYVKRALPYLARQAATAPWKRTENYFLDFLDLRFLPVRHPALRFGRRRTAGRDSGRWS